MGSIRHTRSGKEEHWFDAWRKPLRRLLWLRPPKPKKSLDGQQLLFEDVDISHLKKPKKEKEGKHDK